MSAPKINVKQKSAAEFFSEHQQIAGFDNPGKSLYTSIRELVENSLDAAESIGVLPSIDVSITEYTEAEHNSLHGITNTQVDSTTPNAFPEESQPDDLNLVLTPPTASQELAKPSKVSKKTTSISSQRMYYKLTCKDNGCGMSSHNIGELLGRVLSGSKHGTKQTRGKFGLGAKMALIWSKKSSGLPIEISSCQYSKVCNYGDTSDPTALDNDEVQSHYGPPVSHVLLDMDIFKNEPKILSSTTTLNAEKAKNSNLWWHGTEITITIAGSWSNYKSRILQYFQQLAVITPYADLNIYFRCIRDPKKDFSCDFQKRSEQMPPMAREILPHPNSLNHITLTRLIQESRYYQKSLSMFLMHELSGINNLTAEKIIRTLVETSLDVGSKASTGTGTLSKYDVIPSQLTSKNITALSQLLRDESSIKQPNHTNCIFAPDSSHPKGTRSGSCLSPVGEYNLRLGILKELKPRLIATYSDASTNYGTSSSSQHHYEGHPFVVEAAVALGSSNIVDMNSVDHSSNNSDALDNQDSSINQLNTNTKEQQYGIHIYRFANRIPLLFETGADVITQVATKHIPWNTYLIDPKKDNIGVFVSIVSTKIPYKGTSKEYIGADIVEISKAVKHAIQSCCQQLRIQLHKSLKLRQDNERKKILFKYIPNITNALFEMASNLADYMDNETDRPRNLKRQRSQLQLNILDGIRKGKISKNSLSECLTTGVNKYDDEQLQMSNTANMKNSGSSNSTASNNSSWLSLLQNPSYNENIEARSSVLDRPAMELVKNAPFLPVCNTEDGVVRQDHQVPSVFVKIFE